MTQILRVLHSQVVISPLEPFPVTPKVLKSARVLVPSLLSLNFLMPSNGHIIVNLKVHCGITTQISCLWTPHDRCSLDLDFFPSGLFHSQLWITLLSWVQLKSNSVGRTSRYGMVSPLATTRICMALGTQQVFKYSQWLAGKPTHFNLLLSLWISMIEYIFRKFPRSGDWKPAWR